MSISDEIERLERLCAQGSLTEEEFQQAKSQVLNGRQSVGTNSGGFDVGSVDENTVCGMETDTWCMLMHLSQLLHFAAGAGVVIPIVMWAVSKDKNSEADRHGVAIMNWMITLFVALAISGVLSLVLVGIPFLIIYGLLSVIFPIVAAIKAAGGEHWIYPTSIRFIKEAEELYSEDESSYF
ncbi:DUF4870 domain-containing protein [bacterium]|jgi:uncharacterized protein|nr:DUF4870 domain-containing protein [bacterium]